MSERSDQKRPLPPAILADALQDRPSKPDVTAQAFREAAAQKRLASDTGSTYISHGQIEADIRLLLAAAEQREQWEAQRQHLFRQDIELTRAEQQIATLTADRDLLAKVNARVTDLLTAVTAERDEARAKFAILIGQSPT